MTTLQHLHSPITVLGAGAWGTTMAHLLALNGHQVTLWSRARAVAQAINRQHRNPAYTGSVRLSPSLKATTNASDALLTSSLVITAIPVEFLRATISPLSRFIPQDTAVVNIAKGLEHGTLKRPSQIIADAWGRRPIASLSGPNLAREILAGQPTKTVLACADSRQATRLRRFFVHPTFSVYTTNDIIGLELGGALKNIYAILAGMSDGLGYGLNTKAAIVSRSIMEMNQVSTRLGGKLATIAGLSGVGDLIVTAMSTASRNHRLGVALGAGKTRKQAEALLRPSLAEGVNTARSLTQWANRHKQSLPLLKAVSDVLFRQASPRRSFQRIWQNHDIQEFTLPKR